MGAIVSSTSYDSFGNAIPKQAAGSAASSAGNAASSTGSAVPNIATSYRYTGREYDADIGLYYYRNRWYDPEVGRFISEDPIGFAGGDINLYGYVGNNPLNFIDPYGNYACKNKRQQDEKCDLVAASFDELKDKNPHALALLNATYGEYRARGEYIGWTTYLKAVFLNTTAAVGDMGLDLSRGRFEYFYDGDKGVRAYGIIVSGFTGTDLDNVELRERRDIIRGIEYGRRPPKNIKEGSVEATLKGNEVAFDVDLYNPHGNRIMHGLEVLDNFANNKATHPKDVVEKLNNRGVLTGVTCRNGK